MKVLFCTNDQVFQPSNEPHGFYLGMGSLGHEVEVFFYRKKSFFYSNFRKRWVRWMNRRLGDKVIGGGFDLLLVHRGGYVAVETLERIRRESHCRSVCFYPDNPFGAYTPPLPFDLIAAYDLFVTKDTYFEEEFRVYGFDNVVALPHAYDPSEFEMEFTEEEMAPFRGGRRLHRRPPRGFGSAFSRASPTRAWTSKSGVRAGPARATPGSAKG